MNYKVLEKRKSSGFTYMKELGFLNMRNKLLARYITTIIYYFSNKIPDL